MRVAVTGATGSLGRALVARLVADGADRVVGFSRDEQKRAALQREFAGHHGIRVMAGDVRDPERMRDIFHGCEVVVHAAARKVVSAHPDEPEEMLKTNVLGTNNVVTAAAQAGVGRVLVISSDKAVQAENVYGTSKAMAEHLAICANARTWGRGTRVSVLRYGNVLASNGSVVRLWREALRAGQPLDVTDPRMTRFWLTLPQAVDLVIKACATMRGGETFVPHLPAAPILTLAHAVAASARGEWDGLSSPVPDFRATAIRPGGEKLHESLLSEAEARRALRVTAETEARYDFYVVPPFQHDEMWDARPWRGTPLPDGTVYRSDVWGWQLTVEQMAALVSG